MAEEVLPEHEVPEGAVALLIYENVAHGPMTHKVGSRAEAITYLREELDFGDDYHPMFVWVIPGESKPFDTHVEHIADWEWEQDENEDECTECGEPMFVTDEGIAHHRDEDAPDGIDHDADEDHVPLRDTDE